MHIFDITSPCYWTAVLVTRVMILSLPLFSFHVHDQSFEFPDLAAWDRVYFERCDFKIILNCFLFYTCTRLQFWYYRCGFEVFKAFWLINSRVDNYWNWFWLKLLFCAYRRGPRALSLLKYLIKSSVATNPMKRLWI